MILGGTDAVSDGVKGALEAFSIDPVARRAGADRYKTAVDISSFNFTSASKVYLATGRNFPDALAAGSPGGIAKAPVLLTQAECIPTEVKDEITRLNPSSLVAIGGPSAVSDAAMNQVVCAAPTTTQFTAPQVTQPPAASCTPGYAQCLTPNIGDYDCAGGSGNGPNYVQGPFAITGPDIYELDADHDGIACENG